LSSATAGDPDSKHSAVVPRERATARRPLGRALRLAAVEAGGPERPELEDFVGTAFKRKHDATVTSYLPTLLSFRDPAGALRGVVGLRGAGEHRLYLEQYLEQSIEAAITAVTGRSVRRQQVVEVGNLAGTNCRSAVRMVALLPSHLLARDFQWIVFTATSAVRGILLGFGAPLIELARADGARVANDRDEWGRYYDADPRVFAGFLPDSLQIPGFGSPAHDH
jgi:Thermostable hemolysin